MEQRSGPRGSAGSGGGERGPSARATEIVPVDARGGRRVAAIPIPIPIPTTPWIATRLGRLTRRALTAFAVRCARRLERHGGRLTGNERVAIDRAIEAAEAFARRELRDVSAAATAAAGAGRLALRRAELADADPSPWCAAILAGAAAAARSAAAHSHDEAARAALDAWNATIAIDHSTIPRARADLLALLELPSRHWFDRRGRGIDPSERGPLGPLGDDG